MDSLGQGPKLSLGESVEGIPDCSVGLVQTVRGRHGGYTLGKAPGQITVLDVIESFEGSLELVNDDNRTTNGAGVEIVWRHLAGGLREAAAGITLASILENQNEGMPDYII